VPNSFLQEPAKTIKPPINTKTEKRIILILLVKQIKQQSR